MRLTRNVREGRSVILAWQAATTNENRPLKILELDGVFAFYYDQGKKACMEMRALNEMQDQLYFGVRRMSEVGRSLGF